MPDPVPMVTVQGSEVPACTGEGGTPPLVLRPPLLVEPVELPPLLLPEELAAPPVLEAPLELAAALLLETPVEPLAELAADPVPLPPLDVDRVELPPLLVEGRLLEPELELVPDAAPLEPELVAAPHWQTPKLFPSVAQTCPPWQPATPTQATDCPGVHRPPLLHPASTAIPARRPDVRMVASLERCSVARPAMSRAGSARLRWPQRQSLAVQPDHQPARTLPGAGSHAVRVEVVER